MLGKEDGTCGYRIGHVTGFHAVPPFIDEEMRTIQLSVLPRISRPRREHKTFRNWPKWSLVVDRTMRLARIFECIYLARSV